MTEWHTYMQEPDTDTYHDSPGLRAGTLSIYTRANRSLESPKATSGLHAFPRLVRLAAEFQTCGGGCYETDVCERHRDIADSLYFRDNATRDSHLMTHAKHLRKPRLRIALSRLLISLVCLIHSVSDCAVTTTLSLRP